MQQLRLVLEEVQAGAGGGATGRQQGGEAAPLQGRVVTRYIGFTIDFYNHGEDPY